MVAEQDLNAKIAKTRSDIAAAALACDYDALTRLAEAGDEPFTFSFGTQSMTLGRFLQEEERVSDVKPLISLVKILNMRSAVTGDGVLVWPAIAARRDGDYLSWRTGIAADGEWMYFVAGD